MILTLGVLVSLAAFVRGEGIGSTYATYSKNGFDLKIDSRATYNDATVPSSTWALKNLEPGLDMFWNFGDIKPGDDGRNTISFHVNKDAYICLDFEKFKEKENGENEPESHEDVSVPVADGELGKHMEFFAWYDDGDDTFEVGEQPIFGTSSQSAVQTIKNKTYALADSLSGQPFKKNQTRYIGILWCAGDLTVNLATAAVSCNGATMGNEAQTDSMEVSVSFRAVPSADNKKFRCDKQGQQCVRSGCNTCSKPVKIIVNNNGTVNSTTTSSSNTGGNNAGSGGTVNTGNSSSSSNSTNVLNLLRTILRR